jgi:hypothetical protein
VSKRLLALCAALAATGIEVFCTYDGLRQAPGAQLAAGVGIAILGPLVPAFIEGLHHRRERIARWHSG